MCSLSLLPGLYHIIQEKINNTKQLAFIIASLSEQMRIARYEMRGKTFVNISFLKYYAAHNNLNPNVSQIAIARPWRVAAAADS